MTDANLLLLFQPARDLFWTPILPQQALHHAPDIGCDPGNRFLSALGCQFMGLLWTVTAFASIAIQFAADTGLVNTNHFCNLRKGMFGFLQHTPALAGGARVNLVSLCLGKLVVGSHSAPLTWSSEK